MGHSDGMDPEQNDLGALLRAWRDRLSPVDVGLEPYGLRRAHGLRREELAQLAALSVDYVVRLEQGRSRRPSQQVVRSLARALQLTDEESAVLHQAAGLPVPSPRTVSTHVPPGIQRLVRRMPDLPVGVFSASWDLVHWNPMWSVLVGDPDTGTPRQRNLVHATFCNDDTWTAVTYLAGSQEDEQPKFESALVADLRRAVTSYPEDQELRGLVAELNEVSPHFRELWATGVAGRHEGSRKRFDHPLVGSVELDCDVLTVGAADLRIVLYTAAAGSIDLERLEFLRVSAVHGTARRDGATRSSKNSTRRVAGPDQVRARPADDDKTE